MRPFQTLPQKRSKCKSAFYIRRVCSACQRVFSMLLYRPFHLEVGMSKQIHRFLIGAGLILGAMGIGRLYNLFISRSEDSFFAPHLLVTFLSLWIASSILRVGLRKKELTRRTAITLIRSGSILLMIWGYRFYLILRRIQSPIDRKAHFYLALLYMTLGTMVMVVGLKVSRTLRKSAGSPVPIPADSLAPEASVIQPIKK